MVRRGARPRYKEIEPGPSDMLDSAPGTRKFIGQTGQVETGPAPQSGFVVAPDTGGRPSYQFRIDARAPLAKENKGFGTGLSSDAGWAATFRGNSSLGVAAGFDATNPAIGNSANRIFGRSQGGAPSIAFDAEGNAQPTDDQKFSDYFDGQGNRVSGSTPPASTIDDVIAHGEAYHKANGLDLPSITNNPDQSLSQSGGVTFGAPTGDAAKTILKYGDPNGANFTQYGGPQAPLPLTRGRFAENAGDITNPTFAGTF